MQALRQRTSMQHLLLAPKLDGPWCLKHRCQVQRRLYRVLLMLLGSRALLLPRDLLGRFLLQYLLVNPVHQFLRHGGNLQQCQGLVPCLQAPLSLRSPIHRRLRLVRQL